MLMKSKKQGPTKRKVMMDIIRANPGITSTEIATKVGLPNSTRVTSILWKDVRSERIIVERVSKDGRWMNSHYLPDQVPADAVERIRQRVIGAEDVIPTSKSPDARNSVFDVPGKSKLAKKRTAPTASQRTAATQEKSEPRLERPQLTGFACAVTSDGRLVLMRGGQIEFALSDTDVATLRTYLFKAATANALVSLA